MKVFFVLATALLVCVLNPVIFSSCASPPPPHDAPPLKASTPLETGLSPLVPEMVPAAGVAETVPELPVSAENIMGQGIVLQEKLADFLLYVNIGADSDFVRSLSLYYIEEAAAEGVNHDTAFAQMCLETGFLRFGGLVTPDMNNFCGLGAIGPQETGLVFPDPRTGVRAHIQHLKAYATDDPLNQELVDPRFHYVKRGSSPAIQGLAGTWAADRSYHTKIRRILNRLYEFSNEE
ncbi:MAG: glucosaminidase domain-containing protein [Treponema sp.]|jgi:hypothetical protein|nr:glucosaminidase domain-containing protein [Treponema sp.]